MYLRNRKSAPQLLLCACPLSPSSTMLHAYSGRNFCALCHVSFHRYGEAAKIKKKADELVSFTPVLFILAYITADVSCGSFKMAWEEEKWNNQRQAEMYQKEMRFKHQLKSELVALKKRIVSGKQEQKRQRQLDLQRCV